MAKEVKVKDMSLTGRDVRHLMYIERWLNYSQETGIVSLDEVIRKDHKNGGKNFSTVLSDDDTVAHSFGMGRIPKANVLIVGGINPRAVAYAAEIAVRHRDQYGYMPELMTIGDGRGMFRQRRDMAECFAQLMVQLGFDEEWATCSLIPNADKNRNCSEEVAEKLSGIFCRHKPKVLVVMANNLLAVQELPAAMPFADFYFFEVPQLELSARLFDAEVFSEKTYAADTLLAKAILAQLHDPRRIDLSIDKKLERPCKNCMKDLILRGYAGCITKPEMWEFIDIPCGIGQRLHQQRIVQLQKLSPRRFEDHLEKLVWRIKKSFSDRGLVID